jgi:hypothetical protein
MTLYAAAISRVVPTLAATSKPAYTSPKRDMARSPRLWMCVA